MEDISGNSLFIKWVMITASLAILVGLEKSEDLVDRMIRKQFKNSKL